MDALGHVHGTSDQRCGILLVALGRIDEGGGGDGTVLRQGVFLLLRDGLLVAHCSQNELATCGFLPIGVHLLALVGRAKFNVTLVPLQHWPLLHRFGHRRPAQARLHLRHEPSGGILSESFLDSFDDRSIAGQSADATQVVLGPVRSDLSVPLGCFEAAYSASLVDLFGLGEDGCFHFVFDLLVAEASDICLVNGPLLGALRVLRVKNLSDLAPRVGRVSVGPFGRLRGETLHHQAAFLCILEAVGVSLAFVHRQASHR